MTAPPTPERRTGFSVGEAGAPLPAARMLAPGSWWFKSVDSPRVGSLVV